MRLALGRWPARRPEAAAALGRWPARLSEGAATLGRWPARRPEGAAGLAGTSGRSADRPARLAHHPASHEDPCARLARGRASVTDVPVRGTDPSAAREGTPSTRLVSPGDDAESPGSRRSDIAAPGAQDRRRPRALDEDGDVAVRG
jgi:hypothetical protein